ncbi:MAG: hypothetical protein WBA09_22250 [Candidatus Acidiferrum sp.]
MPDTQNPTQKGPQPAHLIEVKIFLNKVTREVTIQGPVSDAIFFHGLMQEAIRVYNESRAKTIVSPLSV